MIIKVEFIFRRKKYRLERDETKLDHNNPDEDTAYFIEKRQNHRTVKEDFRFFEVHIVRQKGSLVESGYVAVYFSLDDVIPRRLLSCKVTFEKSKQ